MVKKIIVSLVVGGGLVVGATGVGAAASTPSCVNSTAALALLHSQESKLASALAAMKAHEARAPWLRRPIAVLTRDEAFLAAQVDALVARCPSGDGGVTLNA